MTLKIHTIPWTTESSTVVDPLSPVSGFSILGPTSGASIFEPIFPVSGNVFASSEPDVFVLQSIAKPTNCLISLLEFDNDFTDEYNKTWTAVGSPVISSDQKKFGPASLHVSSYPSRITCNSQDFNMGLEPYTIDFWIYPISKISSDQCIVTTLSPTWTTGCLALCFDHDTSRDRFSLHSYGYSTLASANTFPYNNWHHVALVRENSTTLKMFINGNLETTGTIDASFPHNWNTGNGLGIGGGEHGGAGSQVNAYIDRFRAFKGAAFWTKNFDPIAESYIFPTNVVLKDGEAEIYDWSLNDTALLSFNYGGRCGNVGSSSFIPAGGGPGNSAAPGSSYSEAAGGRPGTQTAGGSGGIAANANGGAGSKYTGGRPGGYGSYGGSGGGGWYGGGGGGYGEPNDMGGGGGGSGYIGGANVTSGVMIPGIRVIQANSNDEDNNGAGAGGAASTDGSPGKVIIDANGEKTVFTYTGADQTYTVPAGIASISIKLWGGGGGGGAPGGWNYGFPGGGAGCTTANIAVSPGQILTVMVGAGGNNGTISTPTVNYGGGGITANSGDNRYGGQGGGRSAIRINNEDIVTAGGGGGGGSSRSPDVGQLFSGGGNGGGGAASCLGNGGSGGAGGSNNQNNATPGQSAETCAYGAGGGGGGGGASADNPTDGKDGGAGGKGFVSIKDETGMQTTFSEDGSYIVPADVTKIYITAVGGGGGGGAGGAGSINCGSGGGGGGRGQIINHQEKSVTPEEQILITIGLGGAGGIGHSNDTIPGNSGDDGGTTTVGNVLALGGKGGQGGKPNKNNGGAGGNPGGGSGGVGTAWIENRPAFRGSSCSALNSDIRAEARLNSNVLGTNTIVQTYKQYLSNIVLDAPDPITNITVLSPLTTTLSGRVTSTIDNTYLKNFAVKLNNDTVTGSWTDANTYTWQYTASGIIDEAQASYTVVANTDVFVSKNPDVALGILETNQQTFSPNIDINYLKTINIVSPDFGQIQENPTPQIDIAVTGWHHPSKVEIINLTKNPNLKYQAILKTTAGETSNWSCYNFPLTDNETATIRAVATYSPRNNEISLQTNATTQVEMFADLVIQQPEAGAVVKSPSITFVGTVKAKAQHTIKAINITMSPNAETLGIIEKMNAIDYKWTVSGIPSIGVDNLIVITAQHEDGDTISSNPILIKKDIIKLPTRIYEQMAYPIIFINQTNINDKISIAAPNTTFSEMIFTIPAMSQRTIYATTYGHIETITTIGTISGTLTRSIVLEKQSGDFIYGQPGAGKAFGTLDDSKPEKDKIERLMRGGKFFQRNGRLRISQTGIKFPVSN